MFSKGFRLLPIPGEMRFIARLDRKVFSMGNPDRPGDDTSDHAIESKDIFIQADGRTTSKYYSGVRFINVPGCEQRQPDCLQSNSRASNAMVFDYIGLRD